MKYGSINLDLQQLTIQYEIGSNEEPFEKDISFWPPEQPAKIFEEEGITGQVTVFAKKALIEAHVDLSVLTEFLIRMQRPL